MAEDTIGVALSKKSGTSTTAVAAVTSINGVAIARETNDVTDLDDTWRQHQASLKDGGEVSFMAYFDPDEASHESLFSDFTSASTQYQIEYPGTQSLTQTFDAVIQSLAPSASVGEAMSLEGTLRVTGAVTSTFG
jgi:hypothetical protein